MIRLILRCKQEIYAKNINPSEQIFKYLINGERINFFKLLLV